MKLFALRLLMLWTLPLSLTALILDGKKAFYDWLFEWRELWRDLPNEVAELDEEHIEF